MGNRRRSEQCPKCFTLNAGHRPYCDKCGAVLDSAIETLAYDPSGDIEAEGVLLFKPGELFDNRYRIVEEIGRGGMGRVYKAEDTELDITVALKIIRPKYSKDHYFIERFKKETLTARSISHENIIRIFDLGEAEKTKYISMEYIKGQSLRELIQASGSLTVKTALNIARQIVAALKAAHNKGIIHRDLKPSNILVGNDGQVYVMDFGLAMAISEVSLSGESAGTPQYMSPEQVKSEKLDPRTDIYSFGAILYEMLTGRRLFEEKTPADYKQHHISEIPSHPSKINTFVPSALNSIVLKCLEKDREKRFQNVGEILIELDEKKLLPQPVSFKTLIRKYRYFAAVSAAIVLLALSLLLFKTGPSPMISEGRRISVAVIYLTNNTGDRNYDYLSQTFPVLMIADLLQSRYIRVLTVDRLFEILQQLDLHSAENYTTDNLAQIANLGGVDFILQGNFTLAEDTFRINTSLHEKNSMKAIGSEVVTGVGIDSMYSMVDDLTRKIKEDLNLSREQIEADIDEDVKTITTDSDIALKYYSDGLRLSWEGKFEESNEALNEAVNSDPNFALAYMKLSENYTYLGDIKSSDSFAQKALSLLNRVSEREFHLIQGSVSSSIPSSIESFERLLELYPDDIDGNSLLGSLYRNIEEWDLALKHSKKVCELDRKNESIYESLVSIYMAKGHYEDAIKILESNRDVYSDPSKYHMILALCYLCQGKLDLALVEAEQANSLNDNDFLILELKAHILQCRGEFDLAEDIYKQLINMDNYIASYIGRYWLSYLYLMQGKYSLSKEQIRIGLDESRQIDFIYGLFGFALLSVHVNMQEGRFQEAQDAANNMVEIALEISIPEYTFLSLAFRGIVDAKIKRFNQAHDEVEKLNQQVESSEIIGSKRYVFLLTGQISSEEGYQTQAIDDFNNAISFLPQQHSKSDKHIIFYDSLASAYRRNGDIDKAIKSYQKILNLTSGRLKWGDLYAKSYYWLGKLHQEKGLDEDAKDYYNKFLEIWSYADPGLGEIEDARLQLASIE